MCVQKSAAGVGDGGDDGGIGGDGLVEYGRTPVGYETSLSIPQTFCPRSILK